MDGTVILQYYYGKKHESTSDSLKQKFLEVDGQGQTLIQSFLLSKMKTDPLDSVELCFFVETKCWVYVSASIPQRPESYR